MSNTISWTLRLAFRDGQLEAGRSLLTEMVETVRQEPGTQAYEFFLSGDNTTVHSYERFVDADAALVHVGNFGAKYMERFMACFQPTELIVYGAPTDSLKGALDGLGAQYYALHDGFAK